jgi:hypothetical protein
MAGIQGIQLADAPFGVATVKINDNAVTSAKVDGSVLSINTGNTMPGTPYTALGQNVSDVAPGVLGTDAVNVNQLNAIAQGMTWKANCETGTAGAVLPNVPTFVSTPGGTATLTANAINVALNVGGVNITKLGQRVLVADQAASEQNGIYELTQAGAGGNPWVLTRALDMNANTEVPRAAVSINNALSTAFGLIYLVTFPLYPAPAWVLNVDLMTWTSVPVPATLIAGLGVSISGVTISTDITATPNASGRGLTYVGNKLSGDIEPNKGMKFDDTTGRFETYLSLTPSVEGGIGYGASGGLVAFLEPSTASDGGLQIGPNAGIEVKIDATNSGLKYTPTGISVKPKNNVVTGNEGGLSINGSGELVAKANNVTGGLQINGSNEIEAKIEPSTAATGGLEIGPSGGLQQKLEPSGGLEYTATGVGIDLGNPANQATGLSLSAAGLYNNVNYKKQWSTALVTTGSGEPITADTLALQPWTANGGDATPTVTLNGVEYEVANGGSVANAVVYFSPDGIIVRTLANIQTGDGLYQGGGLAFNLNVQFRVAIQYLAAIP